MYTYKFEQKILVILLDCGHQPADRQWLRNFTFLLVKKKQKCLYYVFELLIYKYSICVFIIGIAASDLIML